MSSEFSLDFPGAGSEDRAITEALVRRPDVDSIAVAGAQIVFRVWDGPERATVILVHGGGAHSGWWDVVAPILSDDARIVALDLSGHGDSGWRDGYTRETWISEIRAVARVAGSGSVAVVGHSLGGLLATEIAGREGTSFRGAAAIDSPIDGGVGTRMEAALRAPRRHRIYPSANDAVARFRPMPNQPAHPLIAAHVARASVRRVESGWTWKFDPRVFTGDEGLLIRPGTMHMPYAFIGAANGIVGPGVEEIVTAAGGMYTELPQAGHAPMLDRPSALASVLRALLDSWRSRAP